MKQSQLILAFVVLIVMIFGITFAMNYLGGTATTNIVTPEPTLAREVLFFETVIPPSLSSLPPPPLEREARTTGYQDFWFVNPNSEEIKIGLDRKNCRCTGVEIYYVPPERNSLRLTDATTLCATASGTPFAAVALHALALSELQKDLSGKELLKETESTTVPGHCLGWVRMRYKGEQIGSQTLQAKLWIDNPETGKTPELQLLLHFYEALRVRPELHLGTLRDEDLQRGVTRHIVCWSSTRDHFRVEASLATPSLRSGSDPFLVGTPEPLSREEREALYRENISPSAESGLQLPGQVLCAYRIPVTLRPYAPNGKTPVDLGPFRRWVLLSSPDIAGESKSVAVTGRVRGLVEVGIDDETARINFSIFPRSRGQSETIFLHSSAPGLKLEFDRKRTPSFLTATVTEEKARDERKSWRLRAEVLPDKASGVFPRKEDPLYEDSAIYLKALLPGKPPRSIRIAAYGTASAS